MFLSCAVEAVEAFTIVLAVSISRRASSALIGSAAALLVLAAIVAALGSALTALPIELIRLIVGLALLGLGLQWLRKAVLRAAGAKAKHDEDAIFAVAAAEAVDMPPAPAGARLDPYAFSVSFKAVFLEGLEVVLIVIGFGSARGSSCRPPPSRSARFSSSRSSGSPLGRRSPGCQRTPMKFGVGVLLTAFGIFWVVEGCGVEWPGGEAAAAVLVVLVLSRLWEQLAPSPDRLSVGRPGTPAGPTRRRRAASLPERSDRSPRSADCLSSIAARSSCRVSQDRLLACMHQSLSKEVAVSALRRISTRRLLAICALAGRVRGVTAVAAATGGGGPKPPPKPLAKAVQDALNAPEVPGISARIDFTNNLVDASSIPGRRPDPLRRQRPPLGLARGRRQAAARAAVRRSTGGGDSQLLVDGRQFRLYDGSSETVYEGTLPEERSRRRRRRETVPGVGEIETEIAKAEKHAEISGAIPSDVAGQATYTVHLAPKRDGGLLGGVDAGRNAEFRPTRDIGGNLQSPFTAGSAREPCIFVKGGWISVNWDPPSGRRGRRFHARSLGPTRLGQQGPGLGSGSRRIDRSDRRHQGLRDYSGQGWDLAGLRRQRQRHQVRPRWRGRLGHGPSIWSRPTRKGEFTLYVNGSAELDTGYLCSDDQC